MANNTRGFRYVRNRDIRWTTLRENPKLSKRNARELANLMNNPYNTVYELVHIGDPNAKWLIKEDGVGMPGESYSTKKKALKNAKEIAQDNESAVLVIYYQNGNIQDYKEYI